MSMLLEQGQLTLANDPYLAETSRYAFSNIKSNRLYGSTVRPTVSLQVVDGAFVCRQLTRGTITRFDARRKTTAMGIEQLHTVGVDQTDSKKAGRFIYFDNGGFVLFSHGYDHQEVCHLLGPDFLSDGVIGAGSIMIRPDNIVMAGWGSFKRFAREETRRISPCEDFRDYNAIARHFGIETIASSENVSSLTARRSAMP